MAWGLTEKVVLQLVKVKRSEGDKGCWRLNLYELELQMKGYILERILYIYWQAESLEVVWEFGAINGHHLHPLLPWYHLDLHHD